MVLCVEPQDEEEQGGNEVKVMAWNEGTMHPIIILSLSLLGSSLIHPAALRWHEAVPLLHGWKL